jgi:hypothetical protein
MNFDFCGAMEVNGEHRHIVVPYDIYENK